MIPDQTEVWDKKHANGDHEDLRDSPSPFSAIAEPEFPRHARILELGCGVGRDAAFFAERGHIVTATDASAVVIEQDKQHFAHRGIIFSVLNMADRLPYGDHSFAVVYANLSLHYYSDTKTREIIENISRVIKIGGTLAFACKSRDNYRTEGAKEVEKDVFVADNNHALHLFSQDYVKQLLDGLFTVNYLDEVDEEYDGRQSSIVRCIALNYRER